MQYTNFSTSLRIRAQCRIAQNNGIKGSLVSSSRNMHVYLTNRKQQYHNTTKTSGHKEGLANHIKRKNDIEPTQEPAYVTHETVNPMENHTTRLIAGRANECHDWLNDHG